ncbi:MAG: hypothetical protein ACJ8R9_27455 [Steroidobacteraceae bacterium]
MSQLPHNHVPRLRSRPLHARDLPECMSMLPPFLGLTKEMQSALPTLWSRLVDETSVITGVMEDRALPAGQRVQGWGASILLPQGMVRELALDTAPQPYVSRRIYAALLAGTLIPMTDRDIGVDNARGELIVMILHFSTRRAEVGDSYFHNVLTLANDAFRAFHDGYQLRAIYYQNSAAAELIALSSGFEPRRMVETDQLNGLDPANRPAVYGLTRAEARQRLPGTPARNCFEYQPPRFRFNATQRRLLWHALFDESDDTLLPLLAVSTHGLKKLWRGIYERVESVAPDFFGEATGDEDGKRGPEKRRQVLAYVRQRVEELRPWVATADSQRA